MKAEAHHTSVLSHQPLEQGVRHFLSMALFGFCLSAVLALSNILYGNAPWSTHTAGYVTIAISIGVFSFLSDRIWKSTTDPLVRDFHALISFGSRLPFWYFGGGIGYVIGLLVAKKSGLLTVYDIPVKPLFVFGGFSVMLFRIPFQRLVIFMDRLS